jgi:hypothetical protein
MDIRIRIELCSPTLISPEIRVEKLAQILSNKATLEYHLLLPTGGRGDSQI